MVTKEHQIITRVGEGQDPGMKPSVVDQMAGAVVFGWDYQYQRQADCKQTLWLH